MRKIKISTLMFAGVISAAGISIGLNSEPSFAQSQSEKIISQVNFTLPKSQTIKFHTGVDDSGNTLTTERDTHWRIADVRAVKREYRDIMNNMNTFSQNAEKMAQTDLNEVIGDSSEIMHQQFLDMAGQNPFVIYGRLDKIKIIPSTDNCNNESNNVYNKCSVAQEYFAKNERAIGLNSGAIDRRRDLNYGGNLSEEEFIKSGIKEDAIAWAKNNAETYNSLSDNEKADFNYRSYLYKYETNTNVMDLVPLEKNERYKNLKISIDNILADDIMFVSLGSCRLNVESSETDGTSLVNIGGWKGVNAAAAKNIGKVSLGGTCDYDEIKDNSKLTIWAFSYSGIHFAYVSGVNISGVKEKYEIIPPAQTVKKEPKIEIKDQEVLAETGENINILVAISLLLGLCGVATVSYKIIKIN